MRHGHDTGEGSVSREVPSQPGRRRAPGALITSAHDDVIHGRRTGTDLTWVRTDTPVTQPRLAVTATRWSNPAHLAQRAEPPNPAAARGTATTAVAAVPAE